MKMKPLERRQLLNRSVKSEGCVGGTGEFSLGLFWLFVIQAWFSYHFAGLPLMSCRTIGHPPSVGESPNVCFLLRAGFGPTSLSSQCRHFIQLLYLDPPPPAMYLIDKKLYFFISLFFLYV